MGRVNETWCLDALCDCCDRANEWTMMHKGFMIAIILLSYALMLYGLIKLFESEQL
jgi:hypothetical protein